MDATQKIVPSLWFDRETGEAVDFYVSLFNGSPHARGDSRVVSITRYEKGMEVPHPRVVAHARRVVTLVDGRVAKDEVKEPSTATENDAGTEED